MATYYRYVNWDRKEYFGLEAGGFNGRLSGVGHTPAARALGLLLLETTSHGSSDDSEDWSIIGRWHHCRLSLEPEIDGAGDPANRDFIDISADVIVMLCIHDDADAVAALCSHEQFYLQVAHLVVTWQLPPRLRQQLEDVLGKDLQSRYETLTKKWPFALHTAQLPQTLGGFDQR